MDKYFSISVSSPGKDHFVTIFQDISHRKIAERELMESQEKYMELNLNLEKRVEERTAELTAANKELEAFAYTVSHDLRAPVRAIAGFTSILAEDHLPQLNDEGKRVFGIIQDNTRKMDQLIDDLLKFSRLSRAEMNVTLVNMNELAQLCFRELTAMDGLRSIEFSTGDLPVIKGDYAMLKQVWTNLISNAVKFTGHCESPVIKIDGKYHEGEFVYSIRDNGTGFNMQYSDKLFGVFQRLHSVKEFEGTGVGLAIVKRIILRHGGRIWATAEVGKGAEFLFTLMPR
jgi:light-regulated signal transduction histidine kinase (bacteriophytochrome)